MSVPSNLIPTTITQLPEAPVASPSGYFPIVIAGTTYKVQFSQISANVTVPPSRAINAGTGLTGGGTLSADITIAVANGGITDTQLDTTGVTAGSYGSGSQVPVLTVSAAGRITGISVESLIVTGYVPDTRFINTGNGLTGGGNLSADRTLSVNYATAAPQSVGSATVGTSIQVSRGDHVHPAINLTDTTQTSGILPPGRGGTGYDIVPVPGTVIYSNGTYLDQTDQGTAGYLLKSNGTAAPGWVDQGTLDVAQADNLNGGAANRIAYQTAPDTTGFLTAPTVTDTYLRWNGSAMVWSAVAGAGTVTSVDGSGGTTGLTVSGGPITAAGTLTLGGTLAISAGGTGLSGTPTNGQLLIGDGVGYTLARLTAGTNVTITNSTGSITIAAAGDVVGPAGATSTAVALFDGGTGKLLKNSAVTISSTGVISGVASPEANTDAANKLYVDGLVSTGLTFHDPVQLATTSAFTGYSITYNNGSSGVSATITQASSYASLTIDSTGAAVNNRILVKDAANAAYNGVYYVSDTGSGSTPWVLTRTSDADTYGPNVNQLSRNDYFFTQNGVANKGAAFVCTTSGTITFGTTGITFTEFSVSQVYSVGNGLSLTGTTISLETPVSVLNGGTGLSSAASNGQLPIGNGAGFTLSALTAGTGIGVTNATGSISIANTAPDQTVTLTGGTAISVSGTYPSFTLTNTAPNQTVTISAGTAITVGGGYPSYSITNSSPDQTVTLTGSGGTSISGTYPSFTISSSSSGGTVTSVDVSGGSTGLTTSGGPVTSSGTITLAGTLAITAGGTGASSQSGARTALGLGTMATQDASSVVITGGSIGSSVLVNLDNATGTISGGTY